MSNDEVTIGEVYRILERLIIRVDTLSRDIGQGKLDVSLYNVAHTALENRVTDLEKHQTQVDMDRRGFRNSVVLIGIGAFLTSFLFPILIYFIANNNLHK